MILRARIPRQIIIVMIQQIVIIWRITTLLSKLPLQIKKFQTIQNLKTFNLGLKKTKTIISCLIKALTTIITQCVIFPVFPLLGIQTIRRKTSLPQVRRKVVVM